MTHDLRCELISHGRGEGRNPPALLKSCVNHWLRELDEVLAFHSAQRRHGGVGATHVLFRKCARERRQPGAARTAGGVTARVLAWRRGRGPDNRRLTGGA